MSAVRYRTALIVITLAGFALRVHGLQRQSFWLDEVDAIALASAPLAELLRKITSIGENGPLFFVLLKGWIALAGSSEFGLRFLSACCSTIAIPLIAALGRRLLASPLHGLVVAVLAAASPYYVWYGQDAKMYPLFAALALGGQYALLRGFGDGPSCERQTTVAPRSGWWVTYVLLSSLALYVHLFAVLQIGANTAVGLWLWRGRQRGRRGFMISTAILVLPYVPLALWQGRVLLHGADVGYRPSSLATIVVALMEQLTWHLNPAPNRRWLLVLGVALLWGFWSAHSWARGTARGSRSSPAILLGLWLCVPLGLVWLLQFTVPVFRDRYLIPLLAPMLVALACAAVPGRRALAGAAFVLTPACAGFVAASFLYGLAHRPPNPDFRAAARLISTKSPAGARVGFLAGYAERPFDFYFQKSGQRYDRVTLPYTNYPDMTSQEGLLAEARSLRGGRDLWIVRFEWWLWDQRGLTDEYLHAIGAQEMLRRDFGGVTVTRYQLPATS